jgi:carboxyl-terminal processing protease
MTQYTSHRGRTLLLALLASLVLTARLPADPTPGRQDALVVRMVCHLLHTGHLARPEINEDLSKKLFHKFLKDMDPGKLYFTQSDIDEFNRYENDLSDQLLKGDMSFAYLVYDRYVKRLGERMKLVEELVKAPQDFTVQEYLSTDYDKIGYPQDERDVRERWRKRIKFDLLLHRMGQKPLPDAEARQKVLTRYQSLLKRWKQFDNYDLMEIYLTALASAIDPHSSYMAPSTLADFDIAMSLHLEGIGALLRSENGQTLVAEIVPGGAAALDGRLKPNDKILAVAQGDGKFVDVVDMKITEVVKLIRGHKGTRVELKVIPAEKVEPVVYALTRRNIELKSQEARGDIVEQGKKADGTPYRIGVIDLPSFYADAAAARAGKANYVSATADVRRILKDFEAKGVDGVVLDLRANGGGALSEALALTGLFIDRGPIVQVKGSDGHVKSGNDPDRGMVYGGPLIVLTSRLSASASEILAGALQDYGRALVVGDSATHGKGSVQVLLDLGNQLRGDDQPPKLGDLKLTIQQFYRVNGDSTQIRGVASDVVIPSLTEELGMAEKELENALPFDQVQPVEHDDMGLVPDQLKAILRGRSAERVKNAEDFKKLAREIEAVKQRRLKKVLPLSEKELRDQFTREDAENEEAGRGSIPKQKRTDTETYKFERNFTNNEVLNIMADLLQARKLLSAR